MTLKHFDLVTFPADNSVESIVQRPYLEKLLARGRSDHQHTNSDDFPIVGGEGGTKQGIGSSHRRHRTDSDDSFLLRNESGRKEVGRSDHRRQRTDPVESLVVCNDAGRRQAVRAILGQKPKANLQNGAQYFVDVRSDIRRLAGDSARSKLNTSGALASVADSQARSHLALVDSCLDASRLRDENEGLLKRILELCAILEQHYSVPPALQEPSLGPPRIANNSQVLTMVDISSVFQRGG